MFAQLGEIKFELNPSLNSFTETISYNYAQHERINNKPLLQFLGQNLIEQNIKLNFHNSFCNPEEEIKNLKTVADNATPLKFIKGNGEYIGVFIIEEISKSTEQTSSQGDLVSVQLDIRLREYTGKVSEEESNNKGFKKKETNE